MTCTWCLEKGHPIAACPKLPVVRTASAHGITDPMQDEDPIDQLAHRYFRKSHFARALRVEAGRAGVTFSPETLNLDPDHLNP